MTRPTFATVTSYDAEGIQQFVAATPTTDPDARQRDGDTNRPNITADLDDNTILTTDEFCSFMRISEVTRREWSRCHVGPRWWRFNGNGRLYTTAAELRRFLGDGE